MNYISFSLLVLTLSALFGFSSCKNRIERVEIVVTTDIHGNLFSKDPISGQAKKSSLSKVATLVDSLRKQNKTLLFDNGDLLQGSPEMYYLNYLHRSKNHPITDIMASLGYDAMIAGNHDIECGPEIYNKLKTELPIPWLAANVTETKTGNPFFKPYHVFNIGRKKIAILGLTTPGVPKWLPEKLWQGLAFNDMVESAKKWMQILQEKEKPDFVIGLFHAGWDATYGNANPMAPFNDNASLRVATEVEGFDLIFLGHDHQTKTFTVTNSTGKTVTIVDCGSHAKTVGRAQLAIQKNKIVLDSAWYETISHLSPFAPIEQKFDYLLSEISAWIMQPVAYLDGTINTFDALIKPSSYLNLIHQTQLYYSNASLSLASPFTYKKAISDDTLRIIDIFELYPYENQLYTIKLTGREIYQVLRESNNRWFNPLFPSEKLLLYHKTDNKVKWNKPPFTFITAGGIEYTVKFNNRKTIDIKDLRFSTGEHMIPDNFYTVAVNSYLASGGDDYLTNVINLKPEELKQRVMTISDKEIRWLLADYLQTIKTLKADNTQNWKIEPYEQWQKNIELENAKFFILHD